MSSTSFDRDKELAEFFTNVVHLRSWFNDAVAAPTLSKRLFIIHGVGGVGKSSLLRMFRLHCKSVTVPVALVSGDEAKSALDVLARWADDLKADKISLARFTQLFEHYRAVQAKVEAETGKIAGQAVKGAAKAAIETAASSIPGIGPLLSKLGGTSVEALADILLSRGFKRTDIDLLLDPAQELTDAFLTDIATAAERQRTVLMLDTFEQMTALEDWTREVAQRLSANVLLVIAGRALPNWGRSWESWHKNTQLEELKPMTEDVMRDLVCRYYATMRGGEPAPAQVEAIIRFARGLPMVVTSAVQLWVKYGVEDFESVKTEIVANLVDRLVEGVPNTLIPALEAGATVHWFDQPILRAVMKKDNVRDEYNELRRFPFVRVRVEGLALHDAVREIMNENLRTQDDERYCELHERAMLYFEKKLAKAPREEAERLELERLYHLVCADEEAGIKLFQEMAEELVQYRLVNSLQVLLNEVNSFPLARQPSDLWRAYYNVRLLHLLEHSAEAMSRYTEMVQGVPADSKLRAYVLCDMGEILSHVEYLKEPGAYEKAFDVLSDSTRIVSVDRKTAQAWLSLATIYRRISKWDLALANIERAIQFYRESQDKLDLVYCLVQKITTHMHCGEWRAAVNAKQEAIALLGAQPESKFARARLLGRMSLEILIGRWQAAEHEFRQSIEIAEQLENPEMLDQVCKRLGWVLSLQGKHDQATPWFVRSLEISSRLGKDGEWSRAVTKGFEGFALLNKDPRQARDCFVVSMKKKKELNDQIGLQELFNGLGMTCEMESDWLLAESYYRQSLELRGVGRRHFGCETLTGLIRVKHAQGDYAAVPSLLAEAEQFAQQYEYNDHLASLRLTQGHIAWEGKAPTWDNGFESALHFYQHALLYALRYNRFLLDEVLSGRPQGTPLRPIIPYCLEHGDEGRQMLTALRDWWLTGINDIGTPRPDTISPIPEGIPLLEAERIAREREPGDGSPQKGVIEQIEVAIV